MRIGLDFETSGLFKDGLPFDDPSQPRIAQIGVKLFDANWNCTGRLVSLIKPDGWSMEPDAEASHGISEARCARHGIPIIAGLSVLQAMAANARTIIAHNMEFERKMVRSELARLGSDGLWWQRKAPSMFCTMEASTPVCQIEGPYGFKFPSLEEAHRHLIPEMPYSTKHDAEDDLDAAVRIYRALDDLGLGHGGAR